jgi:hypothetical protein
VAVACLGALGCNALWGVDELTFDGRVTKPGETTSTASGGQGGKEAECRTPADCPPSSEHCFTADCVQGRCVGEPVAAGVECAAASCVDGDAAAARECDGEGNCVEAVVTACAPYACVAAECLTSCAEGGHADCAPGYYCGTSMSTEQECVATLGQGAYCVEAAQCTSGACVDNNCCATPCNGPCDSCVGGNCSTDCAVECQQEFGGLSGFLLCTASDASCRFFVSSSGPCSVLCGAGGCLNSEEDSSNGCVANEQNACNDSLNSSDGICTCGHF